MKNPLLITVLLFVVSCCMPALEFKNSQGPNSVMWGANALAVGWSGIFAGVFAWYANPLWLLGLLLAALKKPRVAVIAGVLAIVLAGNTFSTVGRELPGDEGNVTRTTIIRLLPGCYLWMASLVALPLIALLRRNSSTPK